MSFLGADKLCRGKARVRMTNAVALYSSGRREVQERISGKLRRELGPVICAALSDDGVIEIMVNPDGALWIERLGQGMERAGFMPPGQVEAAIATVAAMLGTVADWSEPVLLCELPLDGSRFTAKLPPVVAAPSFTIRRHAIRDFRLADYAAAAIMSAAQSAILRRAVIERLNILVVGGTGSGKTTLVNALIAEIAEAAPERRLAILEDTRELRCLSPNYVAWRANSRQAMATLMPAILRDRPDQVIFGEVRGREALEMLKAWNTGHPGGISTVHANSALAGLTRLEQLCAEATDAPQQPVIGEAIDLIVFIDKTPRGAPPGRLVKEIVRVQGWDGNKYVTSQAA
jgi:P-type conjugative transfer ATPase TrbB